MRRRGRRARRSRPEYGWHLAVLLPADHIVAQVAFPACHAVVVNLDVHLDVEVHALGAAQAPGCA
eukprot:15582921-Heterocapsa_arctica.AAC.1